MAVGDYLIDPSGQNWTDLLSPWSTILPEEFNLWLVNRMGDAFVVVQDGSVHVLDVGMGVFAPVADNREHFADLVGLTENANNWLLADLVDKCVAADITLGEGQCYGYKLPPMLGGKYSVDNLVPTNIAAHYSELADLYQQSRSLPES